MTIIVALFLFGFIVFFHELGHFLFAKKAGVNIHEFSIGMGPKIITKKKDNINYSIRLLPIGGFVAMEGEDEESSSKDSFGEKTILQRASILFAGPFFNIILAIILFIPVFFSMGVPSDSNVIGNVTENSPASKSGIVKNDVILQIDNTKINSWEDILNAFANNNGDEATILVSRDGEEKTIKVTPEKSEDGRYIIGIVPSYNKNMFNAIISAFTVTFEMIVQMVVFLGQLITGTLPTEMKDSVAGPIGVIGIVSDAANMGIMNLIYIGAVISLNLGVMNLLPIPALDGGRLVFLGIEAIRGKKIEPKTEIIINNIGFMALMGLMIFVTYKDILRLF